MIKWSHKQVGVILLYILTLHSHIVEMVSLSELEIPQKIGVGTFGVVHRGDFLGTEVAIKILPLPEDEDLKKNTLLEVNILKWV